MNQRCAPLCPVSILSKREEEIAEIQRSLPKNEEMVNTEEIVRASLNLPAINLLPFNILSMLG